MRVHGAVAHVGDEVPSIAVGKADIDNHHIGLVGQLRHRFAEGRHEHSAHAVPLKDPAGGRPHELVVVHDHSASGPLVRRRSLMIEIDREHRPPGVFCPGGS